MGPPPSRSVTGMATPAGENTMLRGNNLDIHEASAHRIKERGQPATGGDGSALELRQLSMKVCEKVASKGRTTFSEVADELVAELADSNINLAPSRQRENDERIRKRVYEALDVLMGADIISQDKNEIQWKGMPQTSLNDKEKLKARPHATVEVEISKDRKTENLDSVGTPFEVHGEKKILKELKLGKRPKNDVVAQCVSSDGGEVSSLPQISQHQSPHPVISNISSRPLTPPPLPDDGGEGSSMPQIPQQQIPHPIIPSTSGVNEDELRNTPVVRIIYEPGPEMLSSTRCPICRAEFQQGEELVLPICYHAFHLKCFDEWYPTHSSCKTCWQLFLPPWSYRE